MNRNQWLQAREIFEAALESSPAEWQTVLDHQCGGNSELQGEVEALLAAHREADTSFLCRPAADGPPKEQPYEVAQGERIGPYEIVRRLGRGGMGAVYLAQRADREFRKRVALKILRPDLESDGVQRFRTERQILAALDHPNIARLLDGGTTGDGLPFLVMEYVEGWPIDEYCQSRRLSIPQRLELFGSVCSAVQYAHRNLVVHRDLKPSNILVNSDGEPKLLDFGIAKLLNPELAAPEMAPTATVLRLMTPDYASPEQARGEVITTSADVYALGILLYYLLSGHKPYRARDQSPVDMLMMICEYEPPRPSTIVLAGERPMTSEPELTPESRRSFRDHRGEDPARLQRRLSGDLDNIVMMALRKEPERRYASVEQLAEDLRRHLDGLPVLARKDTFTYRWGKFIRRHRLGVAVVATFVTASLSFGLVMAAQRAEIARERDLSERVIEHLVDLYEAADPYQPHRRLDTLDLLRAGAHRIQTELGDEPEVRSTLLATLGEIFLRLGRPDDAAPWLSMALEDRQSVFDEPHRKIAESLRAQAALFFAQGQYEKSEQSYRQALAMFQELYGDQHPEAAQSLRGLGEALFRREQFRDAELLLREALQITNDSPKRDPQSLAGLLTTLALTLKAQEKYEEAEGLHQNALELLRQELGDQHPRVADCLHNLASVYRARGQFKEAEALWREAIEIRRNTLGPEHPEVGRSLNNHAMVLRDLGRYEEARGELEAALEVLRKSLGEEHPHIAFVRETRAALLHELANFQHREQGAIAEAEATYRLAAQHLQDIWGPESWLTGWNFALLALLLETQARFPEAETLAARAVGILETAVPAELPDDVWRLAAAQSVLAAARIGQGRFEGAEARLRESLGMVDKASPKRRNRWGPFIRQHLAELQDVSKSGSLESP